MILPKKLVSVFDERLGFYSCTVPTFEQYVIARLIQNGDFERHINRVRRNLRKKLKL
jgi:GntR family transcriptional regulator/MocR family aminotransferase